MVAKCVATYTSGEQTLEHIQAVNNDGRVRMVKEFMKLEDSFACNLIYFSPVPLPDQQAPRKGFISEVQFYIK